MDRFSAKLCRARSYSLTCLACLSNGIVGAWGRRRPNGNNVSCIWERRHTHGQVFGVARAVQLMEEMRRSTQHPGRDVLDLKRGRQDLGTDTPQGRHTSEIFEAPRRGKKRGGKPEWVATERVMKILHRAW